MPKQLTLAEQSLRDQLFGFQRTINELWTDLVNGVGIVATMTDDEVRGCAAEIDRLSQGLRDTFVRVMHKKYVGEVDAKKHN